MFWPPIPTASTMRRTSGIPLTALTALVLALLTWHASLQAQIPAAPTSGEPNYKIDGMTDQPFSVEVLDAHRTVGNTLLVRLEIVNRGVAAMQVTSEFADAATPDEIGKISGVYAVDPNGQTKYLVLRSSKGTTICSQINPDLQPGERRNIFTQLASPPDSSSAVSIFFPKAGRIEKVPIGLPESGEPIPAAASIGDPGHYPAAAAPVQPAAPANTDERTTNISPNVVTDQLGAVPASGSHKGIGVIQDGNSVVPFTVEVLDLKRQPDGTMKLRLTLTNDSSGPLDAEGQFTSGLTDRNRGTQISGVYLADPVSHAQFQVMRPTQQDALCSSVSPALAPGEHRALDARFAAFPQAVTTVYVYFPHASPIPDVPVTR